MIEQEERWTTSENSDELWLLLCDRERTGGLTLRQRRLLGKFRLCSAVFGNIFESFSERMPASHLRDLFGSPSHSTLTVDPGWLSWNDAVVPGIAKSIYLKQSFDRCPILADALEESGCTNAGILAHLREPNNHVRGCWALDLLLGKQ